MTLSLSDGETKRSKSLVFRQRPVYPARAKAPPSKKGALVLRVTRIASKYTRHWSSEMMHAHSGLMRADPAASLMETSFICLFVLTGNTVLKDSLMQSRAAEGAVQ